MRLPVPKFKILLFGPGLPLAGIKARAHFEQSVLVIQGKGHWYTIQSDRLNLKVGGYDGLQWLLAWDTPSGPAKAMLQGEDAVELLIKLAPTYVSDEFRRVRQRYQNRRRLFRFVSLSLTLLFLVPALAYGVFWLFSDKLSHWTANQVSQEQKARLGEMAFQQLRPTLKLVERGEVRATVEFIGVRVTTGSRHRYVFHVVDSPQVNAYAFPGGHVVVNTGLLRAMQNANELAAMLAHLASHVEKRHTLSNIIHVLGWRAEFAAFSGDFSNDVWQGMAANVAGLRYSRDMEREADSEALIMLRRAGVSAEGLVPFFQRISANKSAGAGIATTHPASPKRMSELREQITTQLRYQSRPLPVDWPNFQRELSGLAVH